jgi:hypothetical protein
MVYRNFVVSINLIKVLDDNNITRNRTVHLKSKISTFANYEISFHEFCGINPKRGKIYVSFKLIEFHQQCTLLHVITKYNV